jgi:transposase
MIVAIPGIGASTRRKLVDVCAPHVPLFVVGQDKPEGVFLMQVVYQRCCGLDVHKKTVVACTLITLASGAVQKHIRTFSTMTADLLALADWLKAFQVTHVAMESTGVFWKPVFNLLEEDFAVILVNAQHMKAVPGRKTDIKDSEWIADLLRHGLLKASFIPPAPIRVLRELTRYRSSLVAERAQEVNRLQKVLEGANIKLAAVATDVLGKSGRDMIQAVIDGTTDASVLADLARGLLRKKLPELQDALFGRVQPHHRVLLRHILTHIDFLDTQLSQLVEEIEAQLVPFQEEQALLESIPGIQPTTAAVIIAEIGVDMSVFPTAKHLASWAGLCPGNRQSGGKRLSGAITGGNPYLRAILAQVAWAISHTKDNYLSAQYHRLARRLGRKKAIVALAHSVLVIIYHVLRTKQPYTELGADYFDQLNTERLQQHHIRRLEQLGFSVTLTPKEVA